MTTTPDTPDDDTSGATAPSAAAADAPVQAGAHAVTDPVPSPVEPEPVPSPVEPEPGPSPVEPEPGPSPAEPEPGLSPAEPEPVVERESVAEPVVGPVVQPEPAAEPVAEPVATPEPVVGQRAVEPAATSDAGTVAPPSAGPGGEPAPDGDQPPALLPAPPSQAVARARLGSAWRPRANRAQVLAGVLCALLGFALVTQARQTQEQGLDQLRQTELVRLLDNVTNAEQRAEQDLRSEQATRDRLLSSGSSEAAQQAARERLDTLGLLAGTVPASGPGIVLEIIDPQRQVDASVLLDTLEELRDGGAEVVQIGDVRVVAATSFVDEVDAADPAVRVDGRLLSAPFRFLVIGEPQTLAKVLQIPGGVLDVLRTKGAQGKVRQPAVVRVDALRPATTPQYARPAPGSTP